MFTEMCDLFFLHILYFSYLSISITLSKLQGVTLKMNGSRIHTIALLYEGIILGEISKYFYVPTSPHFVNGARRRFMINILYGLQTGLRVNPREI